MPSQAESPEYLGINRNLNKLTTILWHTADWHTNKKTGVRVPVKTMEELDETRASPFQRFLWRSLLDQADTVAELAKGTKAEIWTVFGGDMIEADIKDRQVPMHSRKMKTIRDLFTDTAVPATKISRRLFMVRGTQAHVGDEEETIAADLNCEMHPDSKSYSAHQWLINCDGVRFHIQHHGKLGRLPWTRANALNQKAIRLMVHYQLQRRTLPDVYIQAHNHAFATGDKANPILTIAAPGMSLPDDFSHRIDADLPDLGGLYFICEHGKILEWDVMLYQPKGLTEWSLERMQK